MKHRMILAGILSMAMVLTGCGQAADTSSTEENAAATTAPAATEAPTEEETEAETEAATEEETEAESEEEFEEEETPSEQPASAEELAEVQAAIDGYRKALEEENYADLVKYYDINVMYYMTTGKLASDEELSAELERQVADGELAAGESAVQGEFGAPVCYNSQAKEYNDFLASDIFSEGGFEDENGNTFEVNMAENFTIDGVYMFEYSAAGDQEGMSFDVSMDMAVLRINGEWKVDTGLTMTMALAAMFEGME